MSLSAAVACVLLFLAAAYAVVLYNGLVRLKHGVSKAWSNIDVLLRQRHDELPKLVETCKQYMQYEQDTLEKVMQARAAVSDARARGDVGAVGAAESTLRLGLGNLFAVAEAYPDLKASENMQQLSEELTTTENRIAFARQGFNDAVMGYNTYRQSFPPVFFAARFGHQVTETRPALVPLTFSDKRFGLLSEKFMKIPLKS